MDEWEFVIQNAQAYDEIACMEGNVVFCLLDDNYWGIHRQNRKEIQSKEKSEKALSIGKWECPVT